MTFIEDFFMERDAIFIADSHFKQDDVKMLEYFAQIPKGKQIFLLGDIFHLLIGGIQTSLRLNLQFIQCISQLTYTNPVIFLEGNHDVALKKIWQNHNTNAPGICEEICAFTNEVIKYNANNLQIYSYSDQPVICKDSMGTYYVLAHGDLWVNGFYDLYRRAISNPFTLSIFSMLDRISYGIIYRKVTDRINQRQIAEFSFFRTDCVEFMSHRIAKYQEYVIRPLMEENLVARDSVFCIIEGHYHLGGNLCGENVFYNTLHSSYFYKQYFTFKQDELVIGV